MITHRKLPGKCEYNRRCRGAQVLLALRGRAPGGRRRPGQLCRRGRHASEWGVQLRQICTRDGAHPSRRGGLLCAGVVRPGTARGRKGEDKILEPRSTGK